MSAVDARFAGGTILVQVDEEYTGDERVTVRIDMPGLTLHLFRHEARDLANALREAAAEAGDILNKRPVEVG